MHRRDRVGPHARLGVEPTPRDRRRALRRPGHRHRQVHVREHRHARARHGRRADRRRRRRPRDLPPPVRGHARSPSSSCSTRALSTASQRFDDGALTMTRLPRDGLRRDRRRGELLGGHHRPPARGRRARRSPRSCASCSTRDGAGARRSRCAPPTARSTSRRIARAGGGGGHRQAAGFTTSLLAGRARRVPARSPRSRRSSVTQRLKGAPSPTRGHGSTSSSEPQPARADREALRRTGVLVVERWRTFRTARSTAARQVEPRHPEGRAAAGARRRQPESLDPARGSRSGRVADISTAPSRSRSV